MIEQRANSFLSLIRKSQRGKLKIYLGYSAGVGKTYQMLLEAKRLVREGVNIKIGYVETHGRLETEALLAGLEVIPRRTYNYRDIILTEMDIDAILAERPEVVLVDELAHSNVPGSKNTKRYQDVEEILSAGIHVITTLNIQHLESLYDTVEMATNVRVRERIPDSLLVEADQIVNVDISIEDLINRLKDGKIYVPEGITNALNNFFNAGNLDQLRELTLRELASQIDLRRRDKTETDAPASLDQVMVCLSSKGANREKLLRFTSRLAGRLNRNWYAVYVQTPHELPKLIDSSTQKVLSNTLKLAQQLGATVFTYKGEDIVDTIMQFAREYRVGNIVIGTPGSLIPRWKRALGKKGIAERLIEESGGATIIVFDTRQQDEPLNAVKHTPALDHPGKSLPFDIKHPLRSSLILIWKELINWEEAIQSLIRTACEMQPGISLEDVWTKVLNREQQGSTYLNDEIRFPHCRIESINNPILVIGIAKAGVVDTSTGNTSKLIILLLSPSETPNVHIQMIGYLAKFARDDVFLKQFVYSVSQEEAMNKLLVWDS